MTDRVPGITRTLLLYRLCQLVSLPLVLAYLILRLVRERSYRPCFGERFGFLPQRFHRTSPGAIWLHAVSAGEIASAVPLIQTIQVQEPGVAIYVSTSTAAGRRAAVRRLEGNVDGIFYLPYDYVSAIRRVLRALRPTLLIVLETEIWPNLYAEVKRTGARLLIANGRISSRTWHRYRALAWFFKPVLELADVIFTQSVGDLERYERLGLHPDSLRDDGNLKYDACSSAAMADLPVFEAEQIWIAASTVGPNEAGSVKKHAVDEDDIVLDAFEAMAGEFPKLLLILAPRQPARFDVVAEKLTTRKLRFARRTQLPSSLELPAVLLLDSMGELSGVFSLGSVVFVGGSIAPRGGHNILEPAAAGNAVVIGPHMENFAAIARDFLNVQAVIQIESAEQLMPVLKDLLANPQRASELGARAQRLVRARQGVSGRIAESLWLLYYGASVAPVRGSLSLWFLGGLAALWRLGGALKRQPVIAHTRPIGVPVISIGGISVGGSGKTPFTNYLTGQLRKRGYSPAILTRGYRRRSPAENLVFAPEACVPQALTGDEAQIFLRSGNAPIGIGSDRYQTARILLKEFPQTDVFVLDDGFQQRRLNRDFDVVVIDGLDPFAQCHVVPLGRLREPLQALARADAFIVSRAENSRRFEAIRNELRKYNAGAPVFRTRLVARHWRDYETGFRLPELGAKRVAAFCGLGNPQTFWDTLESLGLDIVYRWDFPDHHTYRPLNVQRLADQARMHGAEVLVTTEKDRVNCPSHLENVIAPMKLAWLEIEFVMDDEEEFLSLVERKALRGAALS